MKNKHNKHQLSQLLGTLGFCDRVTFKSDSDGAFEHDGDAITIMSYLILDSDTGTFHIVTSVNKLCNIECCHTKMYPVN